MYNYNQFEKLPQLQVLCLYIYDGYRFLIGLSHCCPLNYHGIIITFAITNI